MQWGSRAFCAWRHIDSPFFFLFSSTLDQVRRCPAPACCSDDLPVRGGVCGPKAGVRAGVHSWASIASCWIVLGLIYGTAGFRNCRLLSHVCLVGVHIPRWDSAAGGILWEECDLNQGSFELRHSLLAQTWGLYGARWSWQWQVKDPDHRWVMLWFQVSEAQNQNVESCNGKGIAIAYLTVCYHDL